MPGIKGVQSEREKEKKQYGSGNGVLELWLKDGDQAVLSILASGKEDDLRLNDFYIHSVTGADDNGASARRDLYCVKEDSNCQYCAVNDRPSHKFGFWAFVYYILHSEQKNPEEWKAVKSPTGDVKYKEEINNIRVFSRGFGRGDNIWNQVVNIFVESGDLRKQQVRLSRTGSAMDTTYTFTAGMTATRLPDEIKEQVKALEPIRDYYRKRLSLVKADEAPAETESTAGKKPVGRPIVVAEEAEEEESSDFVASSNEEVDEELF